VVAVNVADVVLGAMVTEEGTVNRVEALSERATAVLAATAFVRVTVHVVLALDARLPGLH
jgi:hypothetical protein